MKNSSRLINKDSDCESKKKRFFPIFFLIFLVIVVYFNSLGNDFVSDDISGILQNPQIKNFSHMFYALPGIFRRFILILTANLFGLEPFAFHLVNILFHLGSTIVLYFLITRLFNFKVGLLAASLFAIHPVNTEAVTWIAGGVHSQYSFFLLLAFFLYLQFLNGYSKRNYFFSLVSFSLSLLSAEKSIIFPLILLIYTFSQKNTAKTWKYLVPFFVLSFCLAFGYFYNGVLSQRVTSLQITSNQELKLDPLVQVPVAITSYLELIFWPKNLTLYHSEMSFSQIEYLLRLVVFVFFLGIVVWFFKKDHRIFFWLSFFIISLLPTLTPLGVSSIVAERYVYLGILGIIVPVAVLIDYIGRKVSEPKLSYVILVVLIVLLGTRTIFRNNDWKNQDTLWLATANYSPSSAQNHNNLGDYYGRQRNYEKAIEEFQTAIKLQPNYGDAYHNLGNIYQQINDYEKALTNYQKALEFNPNLWQSLQNIGFIYFNQKNYQRASEYFLQAIKIKSDEPSLYVGLGIIYYNKGDKLNAQIEFKKAFELNPQNVKIKELLLQTNP